MDIQILNCNNVLHGDISIEPNKLNIYYAVNGTGKTTVAKALEYSTRDNRADLLSLTPYQFIGDGIEEHSPSVTGLPEHTKIAIFNEEYVAQYVFLPDELIKDTFEVFIRTPDYDKRMEEIGRLLSHTRTMFDNNPELNDLINAMNDFIDSYGKTDSLSKASALSKGLSKGNVIEHVPEGLEGYTAFLRSPKPADWIKWQTSGRQFMEYADTCPFCTAELAEHKDTIAKVADAYDAKSIEHLSKILEIFERLASYFSDETLEQIKKLTSSVEGLNPGQRNYLKQIKGQVEAMRSQLYNIRDIGFDSLKIVNKLAESLPSLKIDLCLYSHLDSRLMREKIEIVNGAISQLESIVGDLQRAVSLQKNEIQETIKQYQQKINGFLAKAGYTYTVLIDETESHEYKLILKYGQNQTIDKVRNHLSFGERNAFALVLFMFSAIHSEPDLIILDDPISSFDRNKKFAIIDMLFVGNESFRGKTVLFLTHDFEPIIDMVYTMPGFFGGAPKAIFVENCNGNLTLQPITRDDIFSSILICKSNALQADNYATKIIYARRYFELTKGKSIEWKVLSSLIHKRAVETDLDGNILTSAEISDATKNIHELLPDYDYSMYLQVLQDNTKMVNLYWRSCRYEKLQIYRIIVGIDSKEHVMRKFINETFHVENDYLFQLNPIKFNTIPEYIIAECDEVIRKEFQPAMEVL